MIELENGKKPCGELDVSVQEFDYSYTFHELVCEVRFHLDNSRPLGIFLKEQTPRHYETFIGQTIINEIGGKWITTEDGVTAVKLPAGKGYVNPLEKARKFLSNPRDENPLALFYLIVALIEYGTDEWMDMSGTINGTEEQKKFFADVHAKVMECFNKGRYYLEKEDLFGTEAD